VRYAVLLLAHGSASESGNLSCPGGAS